MAGVISKDEAVAKVATRAFVDVVPRFQTIGSDKSIVAEHFYEPHMGQRLVLTDNLLSLTENQIKTLQDEIATRAIVAFTVVRCSSTISMWIMYCLAKLLIIMRSGIWFWLMVIAIYSKQIN